MPESGQPVGLVAEGAEAKANADYSDLKRSTRTTESGAGARARARARPHDASAGRLVPCAPVRRPVRDRQFRPVAIPAARGDARRAGSCAREQGGHLAGRGVKSAVTPAVAC